MANTEKDWFAESNRYAVLLMEQALKTEQDKDKPSVQKIVANGAILADLVEVVRCKDCKYKFKANGHNKNGCPLDGYGLMNDDDFCSCGERREGE